MKLMHFLVVYDLRARRLADIRTFTNAGEATAAYGSYSGVARLSGSGR